MKKGFTLIELSLSMTFISVLSVTIVLIITNAIASYRKGLTLNKINSTGIDLVDDMRLAIQSAPALSLENECTTILKDADLQSACKNNKGFGLVNVVRKGKVEKNDGGLIGENVPLFGAFCTGSYSYIWNSGYFLSENFRVINVEQANFSYRLISNNNEAVREDAKNNFKLLKIKDVERAVCASTFLTRGEVKNSFDIRSFNAIDEEPVDLLASNTDNNLAIYDLAPAIPAESTNFNSMFYTASLILGTIQGGINVMASGNYCDAPKYFDIAIESFDYCAINKFNFAAQSTGV